ncbi:hexameric tyrosine-coordinated heme protein [Planococcus sp. X10-3]|uniref:hexameric tyrosine-coordinated heme protein n=1 Tax=Planococcus sp. X10-3 TaxID=3061240 RepID=UPI003BB05E36
MSQESWLPTLKTDTPEDGYNLAVKLARKAVGMTQPDENVRKKLRPVYANDANSLTFASQVVAIHFQTVAAANNYWNDK